MAIKEFKDIVDRKGYLVEKEDRKIFEREIKKSNFGMGYSDMIEFILYDSNDNQLPQGESGKLVRYIHINDKNINDYFIITKNKYNKKTNDADEFVIDLEKLIREAGYSNGIFKTQVTLLNRRVGSEEVSSDKMWIHEISPSRTEIRVIPLKNIKRPNVDLDKRYDIFTENGDFRDDTIYYVRQFVENVDVQSVFENFLKSKGRVSDGRGYQKLIQKEFKVSNFEEMLEKIKGRYIQSMNYFIDGKIWDITDSKYGKPREKQDVLELSLSQIKSIAERALRNSIEYYLPKRNIQYKSELTADEQVTIDKVKRILKSAVSNQKFESTVPDFVSSIVRGCTDPNALNFNPNAKENDGSCKYKETEVDALIVKGCTDKSAINYNKYANEDDGSCKYRESFADLGSSSEAVKGKPDLDIQKIDKTGPIPKEEKEYVLQTKIFYIWSPTGGVVYTDAKGTKLMKDGFEFDALKLTYRKGSISFRGDVREVPKIIKTEPRVIQYQVKNVSTQSRQKPVVQRKIVRTEFDYDRRGLGRYDDIRLEERDNFFNPIYSGTPLSFQYKDKLGNQKTSSTLEVGESLVLCAQENSISAVPGLKVLVVGGCGLNEPLKITVPKPKEEVPVDRIIKTYPPDPPKPPKDEVIPIYKPVPVIDKPVVVSTPVNNTPSSGGVGSGGGGGGGSMTADVFEDVVDRNDFTIGGGLVNPFTNRGDLVRMRNPNLNFK